jgi:hypothetical protein
VAVTVLLLAAASPLEAQANRREGFWWSFGFGVAQGRLVCDICADESSVDLSGSVRLGGTLSQQWLLGGELNGWTNRGGGVISRRALSATIVALWYPWSQGALFLKGGPGVIVYRAVDGVDAITATRPALELGAGYEWRVSPNFSLSPYVIYVRGIPGELRFDGEAIANDAGVSFLQVGFALVLH